MIKVINGLVTGLAICFPFFLWFVGWENPVLTGNYLITTGILRFFTLRHKQYSTADWLLVLVPVILGVTVMVLGSGAGLYYPVVINLGLFLVFYSSLSTPENLIQQIAEKLERRKLDSVGVTYTRIVTRVWCVFFIFNCVVSIFLSSYRMLDIWTLYNGVIAYVIILIMLGGEKLLRNPVQQKMRKSRLTTGN